jgi:hypothetical protein
VRKGMKDKNKKRNHQQTILDNFLRIYAMLLRIHSKITPSKESNLKDAMENIKKVYLKEREKITDEDLSVLPSASLVLLESENGETGELEYVDFPEASFVLLGLIDALKANNQSSDTNS